MSNFKVRALPFLAGAYGCAYFLNAPYTFAISATMIFAVLLLTKQMDLI